MPQCGNLRTIGCQILPYSARYMTTGNLSAESICSMSTTLRFRNKLVQTVNPVVSTPSYTMYCVYQKSRVKSQDGRVS